MENNKIVSKLAILSPIGDQLRTMTRMDFGIMWMAMLGLGDIINKGEM
jgi:hypothetical protein